MQSINGPASVTGPMQTGVMAPTTSLGAVGGITSALLGNTAAVAQSPINLEATTLSSQLSGSVGALMKSEEEKDKEDWMEELTEKTPANNEESHQLMKSLSKSKTAPGEFGVPIPGLHSDALKHLVK